MFCPKQAWSAWTPGHAKQDIHIRWSERLMFPALQSIVASAASPRRGRVRATHPAGIKSPGPSLLLILLDLALEKDARVTWPLSWILQLG